MAVIGWRVVDVNENCDIGYVREARNHPRLAGGMDYIS